MPREFTGIKQAVQRIAADLHAHARERPGEPVALMVHSPRSGEGKSTLLQALQTELQKNNVAFAVANRAEQAVRDDEKQQPVILVHNTNDLWDENDVELAAEHFHEKNGINPRLHAVIYDPTRTYPLPKPIRDRVHYVIENTRTRERPAPPAPKQTA